MSYLSFHKYRQLLKNYLRPQFSQVMLLAFFFANSALLLIKPRRNIWFLLLVFWLPFPIIAGTDSGVAAYKVKVYRTLQTVEINGELNEPDWQNNRFRLRSAYTAIDENFNPEVGFVQRKGMRRISSDIRYTGWPRRYGIRQIRVTPEFDYILNQDNELETRDFSLVNSFWLESREMIFFQVQRNFEYLDTDFEIREGIIIPVGEYNFNSFRGSVFTDDSKKISGQFGANFGDFFNGERRGFDIKVAFKPNERFRFEPQYQFNHITLPKEAFRVSIFGSRVSYFFSATLFAKIFTRWNSDSDEVFTNFLFSYEYQPGSNFYLVFNQTFDIDNAEIELMDSTVVAKMTYWWNL